MKSVIEIFKPVSGYEGLYEVSDYGAVRSLYGGKVKYLKNAKHPTGYERISLFRDGKKKKFSVHRLVLEAFVGPIPAGMEIDHINGIKDDNRLVNLRVATPKENSNNPITAQKNREANKRLFHEQKWIEAQREGTRKSNNKPILQLDKTTGEVIREWECTADVERELGIYNANISKCCNGKRKSAGGFKWKFA